MNRLLILLCIFIFFCASTQARNIRLAVGPDHSRMIVNNYPLYRASWLFLTQALRKSGHTVSVVSQPWSKALSTVQEGKLDGLFLAANLVGRKEWAVLSRPLGYDYFGFFVNSNYQSSGNKIASVRINNLDQILSSKQQNNLIQVPTAQRGLQLLAKNEIDKFILARGYGEYLIKNELKSISKYIHFQEQGAEKRSAHIALSKQNLSYKILKEIIDKAIYQGIKEGDYEKIMKENKLPTDMWIAL